MATADEGSVQTAALVVPHGRTGLLALSGDGGACAMAERCRRCLRHRGTTGWLSPFGSGGAGGAGMVRAESAAMEASAVMVRFRSVMVVLKGLEVRAESAAYGGTMKHRVLSVLGGGGRGGAGVPVGRGPSAATAAMAVTAAGSSDGG